MFGGIFIGGLLIVASITIGFEEDAIAEHV